MAVAHDADSNGNSGATGVASLTWSHTVTGSNTLLIVGISWTGTSTTISTITYAGAANTGNISTFDATTSYHSAIYWWVAPTTGANNIVVTPSVTASIYGGASSFTGVDQTLPIYGPTLSRAATGSGFGTIQNTFSTNINNSFLFSHVGLADAVAILSTAGGATQAYNQADATINRSGLGEYIATSAIGPQTMQASISGSSARSWAMSSVIIVPVGELPVAKYRAGGLRPHAFSPGLAR